MLRSIVRMPMLLMLLSPGVSAEAAEVLEARVVERESGRPVANAQVTILGHTGERFTDADGRFTWTPAPPPPFEVLVILPGGRVMKPVLVEGVPETGPVLIEIEALVSESVTVAAGAAPTIESTPAAGTTLLTARDLASRAPANLAQALQTVAGVSTVSEGHAAVPAIRGFAQGRTLLLIDGARVSTERRVGPSATFLDPFVLETIDVSRGPGSVAYGSDAFGGVISARTRTAAPGSPLTVRGVVSFGAGIPERRGGIIISDGLEQGSLLFAAHAREFDDYRSPEGRVDNSGAHDRGLLLRFEHALGPGSWSAAWQSDAGRDIERPRSNSRTVRFFYPTEDSHRFTTSYELRQRAGFDRITTTGFLGSYAVVTDQDQFATPEEPRQVERSDVSANDFQVRTVFERTTGPAHVEFGVDVNGRFGLESFEIVEHYDASGRLTATDSTASVDGARRTDVGGFVSALMPVAGEYVLGAGLRADRISTTNTGGYFGDHATANGALSGFASLSRTFGAVGITGQIARGFRDPVLSDRYFRGPTGRGHITGNPDLTPETSLQLDLAVRYTAPRVRAGLFVFDYHIDDLIERYETTPDEFLFRNRGNARVRGIELELQTTLAPGLSGEVTAQVTRGHAGEDESPLDDMPPPSVSLQVRKDIGGKGFVQGRGFLFARDTRPGPTEREAPGAFTLDLSGGWMLADGLELQLVGQNLFDAEYLLSPSTRAVPAPGASVRATLAVTF